MERMIATDVDIKFQAVDFCCNIVWLPLWRQSDILPHFCEDRENRARNNIDAPRFQSNMWILGGRIREEKDERVHRLNIGEHGVLKL
jgi:hypothetical protein